MRAAVTRVTRNFLNSFCEKFRGGLKNLLKRLPSPLVDFKTNPVDQHDQRTIVCFRHADNTSHLKLPLIERVLKHFLDICGNVELRIGVETQTSNMCRWTRVPPLLRRRWRRRRYRQRQRRAWCLPLHRG